MDSTLIEIIVVYVNFVSDKILCQEAKDYKFQLSPIFFIVTKSSVSGKVISQEYILEYGRDCLEMHVGAVEAGERAIVVDDLIATGGTLGAAMDLLGENRDSLLHLNNLYVQMKSDFLKIKTLNKPPNLSLVT